jgi:hypothetical protein
VAHCSIAELPSWVPPVPGTFDPFEQLAGIVERHAWVRFPCLVPWSRPRREDDSDARAKRE